MSKGTFLLGLGIGYVLGTRAGREQYERMRRAVEGVLGHPWIKHRVESVEAKVDRVAREQATAMTDRIADLVKQKIAGEGEQSGRPQA